MITVFIREDRDMEDMQNKEKGFQIEEIVKEFPDAYQECVERNLNATETALNNYILSLVF